MSMSSKLIGLGGPWRARERWKKAKWPRHPEARVRVPETNEFWDTPTVPLALGMGLVAVLAKLTMMHDQTKEQERIEKKAERYGGTLGSVRTMTREEWDDLQKLPPFSPFEPTDARPTSRIRTGDPLSMEDFKDWAIDTLTDALTRIEENLHR